MFSENRLYASKIYAIGNTNSKFFQETSYQIGALGFEVTIALMYALRCSKCEEHKAFQKSNYKTKVYERVKEIADCMIVQGFIGHILTDYGSKNIILLSGDGDFSKPLGFFKENGYEVFLCQNSDSKKELKGNASFTWELENVLKGKFRAIQRS